MFSTETLNGKLGNFTSKSNSDVKETYQKERDMFCLRNLFYVFVSVAVVTSCVVEKLSRCYFSEACINILAKSSA